MEKLHPTHPGDIVDRLLILEDNYHDSITLMLISSDTRALPGIIDAETLAATPINLDYLEKGGYKLDVTEWGPGDLIVAVRGLTVEAVDDALDMIQTRLLQGGLVDDAPSDSHIPPHSLRAATRRDVSVNLAVISVPSDHVDFEVASALDAGLNVFCFSTGMDVDVEAALKREAIDRDLYLMGPDCGTAIIDGIRLGFANVVERGPVGLIGASGTGLQEVICILDRAGVGISQAIGLGSRDLSASVGGIMALRALEHLAEDEATEIVCLISKPPDPSVARRIRDAADRAEKSVILGFLGPSVTGGENVESSLEEVAIRVVTEMGRKLDLGEIPSTKQTNGYVRGLFCGGSLCWEAMTIFSRMTGEIVHSNIPLLDLQGRQLENIESSIGHTFIDFGGEEFTQGRAHPMIDPTLRNERLRRECADGEVGVVLLDIILGESAHPDPAQTVGPIIAKAIEERFESLTVVVALCGAQKDPQGLAFQERVLHSAGALVVRTAAQAARTSIAAAGLT